MSIWTMLLGEREAREKVPPSAPVSLEPLESRLLLDTNLTDPETSLCLDAAAGLSALVVDLDKEVFPEALSVSTEGPAQPLGSPPIGAAPYGATFLDTSEYMIGDVWVTLVLLESDGSNDPSTEDWTPAEISQVKAEVQEGLTWWEDTFHRVMPAALHDLTFHLDLTYADNPVPTQYEPITRSARGTEEGLWVDDFLNYVGYNTPAAYLTDMYQWNHSQRLAHNTEWASTIFVVDSSADTDGAFANGPFFFAWTYVGGPFLYMTYDNGPWGIGNMGEVLAHEIAHIFYALDESPTAGYYTDRSGYYNTQNLNAYSGNPDPSTRVASMMTSNWPEKPLMDAAYANHTSSPSSLEMIGWKDSDGDGIFDVLDVPLTLDGTGSYNTSTGQWQFIGTSTVQTLDDLNPLAFGHDITTNTVDLVQYRVNGGPWVDGNRYGGYDVNISQNITAAGTATVELRTICEETGVSSRLIHLGGAEVTVLGNGISIIDGDTTPGVADRTDLGPLPQGSTPVSHTSTVRNDGTATLTLGAVNVPTGFTLTEGLATSLAVGASDTFTVRLNTTTVGTKTGAISFATNDSDENPFHFTITGTVTASGTPAVTATVAPSIVAEDGATNLVYTFTRSVIAASPLTVNFSVGGTATYPTDYTVAGAENFTATSGTVIIPANQLTAQVTVDPTPDTTVELVDETVILTVAAGTGYTVAAPATATGTILNDDGSANLALGQPAVASTLVGGLLPSNVTDGDRSSPWSSVYFDSHWIYVDLGSVHAVNRIVLRWETAYGRSYKVQVSGDAATWSEVYTTTAGDGGVDEITLGTPASGRYVRMLGTQRATIYGYCLFEFEVYGSGADAPQITVLGNGLSIAQGDSTPDAADGTDFGLVTQGSSPTTRTYMVRNDGPAPLTLGAVTVPAGFTLTEGLATSLAAGASDTFTVQLETATLGAYTGAISFATNDSDENPFHFTITGIITSTPPEVTVTVAPSVVAEDGATNLVYTFTRSVVDSNPLTVNFTVGGTATFSADYTATGAASFAAASGTAVIPASQSTVQVTVDPTVDTTGEPEETVLLTVVAGTGYTVGTPPAATGTIQNDDGGNLAFGKTAVASTTDGSLVASNVTDGNLLTRWSSLRSDPQWIYVDLGSVYTINRIVLRWEVAYGRSYQLQVSNDAATWSDAHSTTTGDGGVDDITLSAPATGRYVQMYGTVRATKYGYSLYEFEVYGDGGSGGVPEVTVLGNGILITDGDTTPSTADATDFGSVAQGSAPVSRTFTVRNDGTATLTLGAVSVPTGFTLTEGLATSLAAGASDTFTVRLETATTGTKTGPISFATNDSDENPFNFTIIGTVTADAVPEVTILGNGISITDGDTTPSTADGTDFGSVVQGGAPVSHTFTVRNDGTATLTLGAVTVPTGFTLTEGLATSLAAGASDSFTVQLDTTTTGTKTGEISFATNDSDENPFNFTITGIVTPSGPSENLALGKTAVASTTYSGLPASNVTDGNLWTRWSSLRSDPEWIYVDLGAVYTIDRIVLRWEVAYGQSYQLQVSNDAATWSDVYSTTTGDGGVDDITLSTPATGRYVRMYGTQRGTRYGYSLYEFEIRAVPVTYTLNVSAANGTVTKTPNQTSYTSGQTVTLQATPNAGYTFNGWSGALTGTANPATVVMDANKSVTANFTAIPVTYTLSVSATNGTVTKTPNQTSYTSGQTVTLQATPNAGHQFSGWSGDLTGTTNPATLVMNANKSVTANFTAIPVTYTLSVSATNGTVTKTPNQTGYTSGQTVTLQATPNAGYQFSGWSGALTGTANPATLVMDANKSVTANFTALTYTLAVSAVNGTVTRTPDQASYTSGQTVTLQATPNAGYTFSGWSGDLTGTANPATLVMDADKSLTATFVAAQAAVYYVDRAAGNDSNDGKSPATAWKTLAKVNSYTGFVPGDQILLHRGHIWREQLIVPASGTADKPILIGAYDTGDRPLLKGSVWLPSWTSAGTNVWTASASTEPNQVFFSGVRGTRMASPAALTGPQQWYWDAGVLYVYATSDPSSLAAAGIEASVSPATRGDGLIQIQDRSYVTVQDLHVTQSASAGICLTSSGQGLTIRNCEVDNSVDGGVVATSPTGALLDVTVQSCLIHHNSGDLKDEGSVNLALGRAAVASTIYSGLPASNATDGNFWTRWSSLFSDNEWIHVDLGSIATIHRIVLRWEVAYGRSYQLQVSNDAATWSDVYSTTTGDGGIDDIMLSAPATGRYVRMYGTQRGTRYGYSLYEFEVYGSGKEGALGVATHQDGLTIEGVNGFAVRDCRISGNYARGVRLTRGSAHGLVENCQVHANRLQNVYLDGAAQTQIRYNQIHDCAADAGLTFGLETSTYDNDGIEVYYNLFWNNAHGISFTALPDVTSQTRNLRILNNTFYNQGVALRWESGVGGRYSGTNHLKNNLLWAQAPTNIGIRDETDGQQGLAQTTVSHNGFQQGAATDTIGTNAQVMADPYFVDPSAYDFHRSSTNSPTIDTGTDAGLTRDFDGQAVPQGSAPDIGAYESAGDPAPAYTLAVSATNGTVARTPAQPSYSSGQTVTLQATPNTGYQFSGWSGDLTGTANPATLVMDANKSVTANFTVVSTTTYTLAISATNGIVTKTPNQTSFTSGQAVTLQAVPRIGYRFSGWSGDLTGTANPATLVMNSSKSVTAHFQRFGSLKKDVNELGTQALSMKMTTDASRVSPLAEAVAAPDRQPPELGDCSPAPDSIQAAPDTLVILHVRDAGRGVDGASVAIRVGGHLVYAGDVDSQRTASGVCYRSGIEADYTYTFQPHSSFGFSREVTVAVEACDRAGNAMPAQTYSFATEMYSFGAGRIVALEQTGPSAGSGGALPQDRPATVRDRQGNLWVAWQAGDPGSRQVYVGMIQPETDAYRGTAQLSQGAGDHCRPALAVDGTGALYVLWQENASGVWDICLSTSVDGQTWSAPTSLAGPSDSPDQPAVNRVHPVIAAGGSSSGLIAAAWQEDRAGYQDIYVARSMDGFQTAALSRVTSDPADQTDPALAIDGQDTVFVLWTDTRNGSADIYGAASNAGPWTNVPVAAGAGNQAQGALAVGTSGRTLHLAWVEDQSGDLDVFYAASEGLPTSPVAGFGVGDDTSGADQQQIALAVAAGADGTEHVFLCWEDARNIAYSGATDLYFADVGAGVLGTNVLVNDGGWRMADGGFAEAPLFNPPSEIRNPQFRPGAPALGTDRWGYPYVVWVGADLRLRYGGATYAQPVPLAQSAIVSSAGGLVGARPEEIATPYDVSVAIPAHSCPIDATIRAARMENPRLPADQSPNAIAFGPSGFVFAQPVTITIPYVDLGRGEVRVYWHDTATGTFREDGLANVRSIRVPSSPSASSGQALAALQFETTRLGSFYLVAETGSGPQVHNSALGRGSPTQNFALGAPSPSPTREDALGGPAQP